MMAPNPLRLAAIVGVIAGALTQAADDPFTDYRSEAPGTLHRIMVDALPAPFASPSASNGPAIVPRPAGALPLAPPGFAVDLFLGGLEGPRVMRTAPNGDVFVAESGAGRVRV